MRNWPSDSRGSVGPGRVDEPVTEDDALLDRPPLEVEGTRLLARRDPLQDVGQRHRLEVAREAHRAADGRSISAWSQMDVPEEVVSPALGRAIETRGCSVSVGQRLGTARLADELHARLLGTAVALLDGCRECSRSRCCPTPCGPRGPRARRGRRSSWAGRKAVSAVLAPVIVTSVDVGAGERHICERAFHPDVTEQAKHRRELDPHRYAADLPIVDGDDLDLALEEHGHGLLPRHDPQGLVGCVQNERVFHYATEKKL